MCQTCEEIRNSLRPNKQGLLMAKNRRDTVKQKSEKDFTFLAIRMRPAEKNGFSCAAWINGLSLSAWVRDRLRACAKRELQQAGQKVPFKD